ncbi:MAG: GNAT family protein [Polyangiaceae bacterium]
MLVKGLAPLAVRQLIEWTFSHTVLNRLEIVVAVGNTRSLRVAEKVGAQREALLRQRLFLQGRPTDAQMFALLRSNSS